MRFFLPIMILFMSLISTIALADEPTEELTTIRFGIISTESADNLRSQWGPWIEAFAQQTGYTVEPFFAPDYQGVIEAMRFGQVEVATMGNAAAMPAVDRAGAEIFAQRVSTSGIAGYHSVIVVRDDNTALQSIDDIVQNAARLNAALGDPNSTSGYLVPNFYVWERHGIVPQEHFRNVTFANHEGNMLAVFNGQADFAVFSSHTFGRNMQRHPEAVAAMRVVWRSPLIPDSPLVMRSNLPEMTKNRIRAFALTFGHIGSPEEVSAAREILANTGGGMGPWRGSNNHQLIPFRQLDLAKQRTALAGRSGMSEADRARELAAIEAQLSDLETMANLLDKGL
ncbi:MAG: phosphate/phosphite/phosphonate ABC transporter substrate-binding protein [Planctomycetota bacterium]|nr:MAG: phosphate/phosphite/phosphonate ABC transporter substrate-binding protein [Planctomycetota bacterium]